MGLLFTLRPVDGLPESVSSSDLLKSRIEDEDCSPRLTTTTADIPQMSAWLEYGVPRLV